MRPRKVKGRKLTKSQQMARVRSQDTEPETMLRKALWNAGMRYRVQPQLPGTPDLSFPGARLAVFIDGCFWHGCPEHYRNPVNNSMFWQEKLKRNTSRDERVDRELAELGWRVVRIWEHEVSDDVRLVVERIRRELGSIQRR